MPLCRFRLNVYFRIFFRNLIFFFLVEIAFTSFTWELLTYEVSQRKTKNFFYSTGFIVNGEERKSMRQSGRMGRGCVASECEGTGQRVADTPGRHRGTARF